MESNSSARGVSLIEPAAQPVRFNPSTLCSFSADSRSTSGSICMTDGAAGAAVASVCGASGEVRLKLLMRALAEAR